MSTPYVPPNVRFDACWVAVPETGCWLWFGCWSGKYGMFWLNGTHVQAHRYSYERFVGPIPEGFFACHKCDTPACVNPNHLFAGTRSDNAQDMVRKGRAAKGKHTKNRKRGCDHPDAKLNDAKVRLIRSSSESQKALGLKFGVSNVAIRCVRIGKTWKHVDQEISP